jgi:hypothetical protein
MPPTTASPQLQTGPFDAIAARADYAPAGPGRASAKRAFVGLGARASYLQRSASAPGPAVRTALLLLVSQLAIAACSSGGLTRSASASGEISRPRSHPVQLINRKLAKRFPGAVLLGEAEFSSAVVDRAFRYRQVGTDIIVERPKEVFAAGGKYRIHWLRTISYGSYSINGSIVLIDCPDCPYNFLGLDRKRIFFRQQGRLFTAGANLEGSTFELIDEARDLPRTGLTILRQRYLAAER